MIRTIYLSLYLHLFVLTASSNTVTQGGQWPPFETYRDDIHRHKEKAQRIIDQIFYGPMKGEAYRSLAEMTDKFGPRLCGSQALEDTNDYMVALFKDIGFDNVHKEPVTVPHWVRGEEWAKLLAPRPKSLAILGLGRSIATPAGGITAEAIVVRNFDELKQRAAEAKGRIVIYNQEWESYGQSVEYRSKGASEAAKVGALAALVRSAASFSIYSPHTGTLSYEEGVPKIPAACLTVEDAEMLWRMSQRGETIVVTLYMEAHSLPDVTSYNVVADITGSTYPDEVVMVSGHLDSWDVGQGAMDDGGGSFISWVSLFVVHQLNLRPKRTLRAIMWSCEEFGSLGGREYFRQHRHEAKNMNIVMESDMGTFTPYGLEFTGTEEAMAIMKELANVLLSRLNATKVVSGAGLSDVFDWPTVGVPGGSIGTDESKYFYFHHSNGDTMTVQDPDVMDACTAVWAVTAFTLADLEYMLPANRSIV